jgi:hypothetical protein
MPGMIWEHGILQVWGCNVLEFSSVTSGSMFVGIFPVVPAMALRQISFSDKVLLCNQNN